MLSGNEPKRLTLSRIEQRRTADRNALRHDLSADSEQEHVSRYSTGDSGSNA